jgi:hypothetical protein
MNTGTITLENIWQCVHTDTWQGIPTLQYIPRELVLCPLIVMYKNVHWAGRQWLTPVILATWEVQIRRIRVQGQFRQRVHESPSQPMSGHDGLCLSSQAEIGSIMAPGQPRQKMFAHLNRNKLSVVAHASHPNDNWQCKVGCSWFVLAWAKRECDSTSKITRAKRAGGVAQALKHIPCKHKFLSLNTSTVRKKKSS